MNALTEHIQPTDLKSSNAGFREEVLRGLLQNSKRLPCKFLYDREGSRLFDRICELDEYYLTRTEMAILRKHIEEISARCGTECLLVELGSGSSVKTRLLLDHLRAAIGYVPVDISREHLLRTAEGLNGDYPELAILPLCADFNQPLCLPILARPARRTIVFFPGSTIGNLEPEEAENLLSRLRSICRPGDALLIGVDLQKSPVVLERAYNDAEGITAAFNVNLLRRINCELGGQFDLGQFRHRAIYNHTSRRIEMHLVSRRAQTVWIAETPVFFRKGEHITTEYSHKYTLNGFAQIARRAGLQVEGIWTDERRWFAIFFLERT